MSKLLFISFVVILWLLGGQIHKGWRRYGVPLVCAFYALFCANASLLNSAYLLLLVLPLSIGYGEHSWLFNWTKQGDGVVRAVCSVLMFTIILLFGSHISTGIALLVILMQIGTWQVRAGSLGKIGQYDILIEDICRAIALALSIILVT